jgi:OmpA-OmpF porin, OOP family
VPGSADDSQSDPLPAAKTAATTSNGLVRRRPGVVWLLAALIVPLLLTAVVLALRTGPIEDDLQERSLAALEAQGITGARVDFSGRDATVVVPAGADADAAREVVARVDGVHTARTASTTRTAGSAQQDASTAQPTTSASTSISQPAPAVAPFSLTRTDKSLSVHAAVPDQETKDAIIAAAQALLDDGATLDEKITVDPTVALPSPTALSGLLRALSTASGDAAVNYDGTTVTLTGEVADQATKAAAARSAATAVPGAVVANGFRIPVIDKPPVSEACKNLEASLVPLMTQHKIGFLSGTSLMNQRSRVTIVRVATLLNSCDSARVEVGGHTDNLGNPDASVPLSQRRADAVKSELIRLGVAGDRITARGYGESMPIASNATSAGRIANRRAEIKIL